jgi:ubiquinone/menaquinone biosynthesis C-methylase UbiE
MNDETVEHYAQRAPEFDAVYTLPLWQDDLRVLEALVAGFFKARRVFEVACGTGYWTRHAARHARSVHGVDLNEAPLALARARAYEGGTVTFARRDAYALSPGPARFDGGVAAFWLSHVDLT